MKRVLAVTLLSLATLALLAGPARAHPLGNFTTNTAAAITVHPDAVTVDSILDLAEIPALQSLQRIDADDDGVRSSVELDAYRREECATIADAALLEVAGRRVPLTVADATLSLPPGEAGLSTLRLECRLEATTGALATAEITFRDTRDHQRIGWREVTAAGDGVRVQADVPATSASDLLRAYPEDRLQTPVDQREATLRVSPGSAGRTSDAAAAGGERRDDRLPGSGFAFAERLTTAFTGLVARQAFTPGFALVALLLAGALGTLHALAPGHGKTVMAAYLVGSRGSRADAFALGATVAVTHTAGVLLLGLALTASQGLAPERLYPTLGAASGVLFAAVGVTLLRTALRNRRDGHVHDHGPDGHTHGPEQVHHDGHHHGHHHGHEHGDGDPTTRPVSGVAVLERARVHEHHRHFGPPDGNRWRRLVLPGLAGGLVPSPSALLVLLGGIALGRAWFGVALVVAYGVGMATTLVGAGLLLLLARTRLERHRGDGAVNSRFAAVTGALPVVTAALIVVGGTAIAARALVAL